MNTNSLPPVNPAKPTHVDAALDEALSESFPASDPVAISFPPPVGHPDEESTVEEAGKDNQEKEISPT